jgi:hypothetical protein
MKSNRRIRLERLLVIAQIYSWAATLTPTLIHAEETQAFL